MIIDFSKVEEKKLPNYFGGDKELCARLNVDENGKILLGTLKPGASIGLHTHDTSSEIIYFISGTASILYDGKEETAAPGMCHYCPKGHSHSLKNNGTEDLVFFAAVPRQ